MASFSRHLEEEKKAIQKLEGWHKGMVILQSLVNKGNWPADTDTKSSALYIAETLCKDLLLSIQEHKSHLTIVDHNPVSVSDSDTERIRANKRQLNQLDEQRIDSSSLNLTQSPTTARKKPQRGDRNRRRTIRKTDKNSEQKLEDRNGIIMNQIIVPKEKANDDGLKWRKSGSKAIRNEIHKKDYYKCASNGCPGKKTVQIVDPELVRIVYYEVHNCGTQDPLVMQQQQQQQQQQDEIGSDQNAGVLVNEAQPEQHQSPIIPQEMRHNVDLIPQQQQTPVIQQEDMMSFQPNGRVLSNQIQVQREQQHDHSLQLQLQPPIVHNDDIGLQQYNVHLIPQFQQQQQQSPVIQQEAREDMMSCEPNDGVLSSQIQAQREQQNDHSLHLQLQPPIVHNDDIGLQQNNVNLIPLFQVQQQQSPVIQQEAREDMMSCQPNDGVLSNQIQVQREQQHDHSLQLQLQPPIVHNAGIGLQQYNVNLIPQFQQQQQQPPVIQQEARKNMMSCQPNDGVLSSQIQVQREQQHEHSLQLQLQLQPPVVHNDGIGLQKYNVNLIPQFQQQQQQTPVIQQEAREDMMICQPNGGVLSSQIQVQKEQQHYHSLQLQPPIMHNDGIGLQQYNVDLIPQFQQQQQQPLVIQQEAREDMMSCQPNSGVLNSQIQREQQHDHWPQLQPPVVPNDGIELEQYNFCLTPHIEWPPVDQYTQMFRSQSEPPTLDLWEHQR